MLQGADARIAHGAQLAGERPLEATPTQPVEFESGPIDGAQHGRDARGPDLFDPAQVLPHAIEMEEVNEVVVEQSWLGFGGERDLHTEFVQSLLGAQNLRGIAAGTGPEIRAYEPKDTHHLTGSPKAAPTKSM